MNRMMGRGRGDMMVIPGGALGKARYALGMGRPDEAERLARKRLEKDAGDANTRVVLAQALLQQGQIDEAAEEARRAIRAQGTNVDAHLVLSSALVQRSGPLGGRVPAEAETAARRAVQLAPKQAKAHVQLAEVLTAKRDMTGARVEADEACRLEPRLAGAHLMRAVVLLSDKDPEGAVQASDAALRNDKSLTQAELIKANAFVELKRYDDSLRALDVVDRQGPMLGAANTQALRGRIYFKQRKYRDSYAKFREVQNLNPRLRFAAPALAFVNMLLVGQFGQNAQVGWIAILLTLVLLILFGLHFIPVVGGWIVAVIVLALVGFSVFALMRQSGNLGVGPLRGQLPLLGFGAVAFAAVLLLAFFVIASLSTSVFGIKHWAVDPGNLVLAGVLGLFGSAGIVYLLNRYAPRTTARA